MEGYLQKKKFGRSMASYKIRWVKIVGNKLEYYKAAEDEKAMGELDLYEMDSVEMKPSNKLKLIIKSSTKKWVYGLQAPTFKERNAWFTHLSVWVPVKGPEDHVRIPEPLAVGLLAAIEFCGFYAQDVEGLFRVPGNTKAVHEIFHGLCRWGDAFLTKPLHKLEGAMESIKELEEKAKPTTGPKSPEAKSRLGQARTRSVGLERPSVYDVFDVGSCVKYILKVLPETLLTNKLFDRFMEATSAEEYKALVKELPEVNAQILKAIAELTLMMWQSQEMTKMDPGKVAICLGPNLLKKAGEAGFCDFSFMFFELAKNIELIFEGVKIPKFFPDDFYSFLSELDNFEEKKRAGQTFEDYMNGSFRRLSAAVKPGAEDVPDVPDGIDEGIEGTDIVVSESLDRIPPLETGPSLKQLSPETGGTSSSTTTYLEEELYGDAAGDGDDEDDE